MRKLIVICCLLLSTAAHGQAPPRTMRVDYFHTGNDKQELFALDKVVIEPLPWPGNPLRPIDELNLGRFFFEVRERKSDKVLYSRGFDSIYGEWVTTAEARKINRTFHESLRFPTPATPVQIVVKKRDVNNDFREVWSLAVDPEDIFVDKSTPASPGELIALQENGEPSAKVDLLLIGDGYTAKERNKFETDARRLIKSLFATSPYKERQRDFNVWGLCPAAHESGVSRPSSGIHRASPLGCTYDIFGLERYMLTLDNKAFRQAASFAPYDYVEIVVNSNVYGGGGIFNLYGTAAAGSESAAYLFVHEFGHHFAGLADEYFTSAVAYLPPTKRVEPWEPNITALLEPKKLKWKELVDEGTPVPTPWSQEDYLSRIRDIKQRREEIRKLQRPEAEMNALLAEQKRLEELQFAAEKFAGKVGAFEGANYQAKGYFRPQVNCIMFSRTDFFCIVCRRAIERVIDEHVVGR